MPNYLTPGQALLKLIKHYGKLSNIKSATYQRLFLTGAIDDDRQIELCNALLDEEILSNQEITLNEHAISGDPVRRYFETHLTYFTLRDNLHKISSVNLKDLYVKIMATLTESQKISEHAVNTVNLVIQGNCSRPSFLRGINSEFNDFFRNIQDNNIFQEFSNSERLNAYWLMATIYISLVTCWFEVPSKITAYTTNSLFTDKGKLPKSHDEKRANSKARNQNYGLLKGYMPVMGLDDIAFAKKPYKNFKASDYNTLNDESPSAQFIMQKLTHPFSNGISGVCLMIIKALVKLDDNNIPNNITQTHASFKLYIQMAISCLTFVSGGHSLFEYVTVLSVPEVAAAMQFVPEYDSINLESLFFDDNQPAFTQAIDNSLSYMQMLEQKQTLHAELKHKHQCFFLRSEINKSPDYVGDILDFDIPESFKKKLQL